MPSSIGSSRENSPGSLPGVGLGVGARDPVSGVSPPSTLPVNDIRRFSRSTILRNHVDFSFGHFGTCGVPYPLIIAAVD